MSALVVRGRRRPPPVEAEVVALVDHLVAALRAGSTVHAALDTVPVARLGGLAPALRGVRARADAGVPLRDAIETLVLVHPLPAVRLLVAALRLGLDTGGALTASLEAVATRVRDDLALAAELRALAAPARASAIVIGVAPGAFTLLVAAVDPAAAAASIRTGVGVACVALGLALDALGVAWIRRLVTVPDPRGVDAELPEAVDLLALSVGSGLTVTAAVRAVAPGCPGDVGRALRRTVLRADAGERLADDLAALADHLGEPARPVCRALVAALDDGAPIGRALERIADDARRHRRARALESARRVPVLLLFPLVVCILPAFVLLTVVPLVSSALVSMSRAS